MAPSLEIDVVAHGLRPNSEDIDLVLLQWRTELTGARIGGRWRDDDVDAKREALKNLGSLPPCDDTRFVIAPELSLPLSLVPAVDDFLLTQSVGTVFITGLQPLTLKDLKALKALHFSCRESELGQRWRFNTAGIWIKTAEGVARYIQLKHNLSDAEPQFKPGRHVYLFQSCCSSCLNLARSNCSHEHPLTFAIAICADFTSVRSIDAVRTAFQRYTSVIDLMIVLQSNPAQRKPAIQNGILQFYVAPDLDRERVDTAKTVLIYANNAKGENDPPELYGSYVFFPNTVRLQTHVPMPTYAFQQSPQYNEAALRDRESCAYHLTTKLVRYRNPGGGQGVLPFSDARHAQLRRLPEFDELDPTRFWLLDTWKRYAKPSSVASPPFWKSLPEPLARFIQTRWHQAILWFDSHLPNDNDQTVDFMALFRLTRALDDGEPADWQLDDAVQSLLRCYIVLTLDWDDDLQLSEDVGHVHFTRGETFLTFLHARNCDWEPLMHAYYAGLPAQFGGRTINLVAVEPNETEPPWDLRPKKAWIPPPDISRAPAEPNELGNPAAPTLVCWSLNRLFDAVRRSDTPDAALLALSGLTKEIFATS